MRSTKNHIGRSMDKDAKELVILIWKVSERNRNTWKSLAKVSISIFICYSHIKNNKVKTLIYKTKQLINSPPWIQLDPHRLCLHHRRHFRRARSNQLLPHRHLLLPALVPHPPGLLWISRKTMKMRKNSWYHR